MNKTFTCPINENELNDLESYGKVTKVFTGWRKNGSMKLYVTVISKNKTYLRHENYRGVIESGDDIVLIPLKQEDIDKLKDPTDENSAICMSMSAGSDKEKIDVVLLNQKVLDRVQKEKSTKPKEGESDGISSMWNDMYSNRCRILF